MLQELWEVELKPESGWSEVGEWLAEMALIQSKSDLVIDAYGARPDTGSFTDFNKAWLVLIFQSLSERQQFYDNNQHVSSELMAVWEKGKKFTTGRTGHYYIHLFK